jgi:hypothetical protein
MESEFEYIKDEIKSFIDDNNRDHKFKIGDKLITPPIEGCTFTVSYDYIALEGDFSFSNPEINICDSEEFAGLSDAQLYFRRISEISQLTFEELSDLGSKGVFKRITPNKNLRDLLLPKFGKLSPEQEPIFFELKLYTNKNGNRAPRIFGFVGHLNILYILFYDPFHEIFNQTGKISE